MVDVEILGLDVVDDAVPAGQHFGQFLRGGLFGADALFHLPQPRHPADDAPGENGRDRQADQQIDRVEGMPVDAGFR